MKIILFRLQKELTKLGIENPEIDAAVDGKEALRFAANYDYDLIITDWSVPPPDGIEITKTIRGETILSEHLARRNIDTAIIGWTTETNAEALQKFLDSGINDQLDKPLTGEGIQRIAMKYLPNFIRQNGN
jgi:CheY-like chemotaxis protein